jgi:hypothetical protein
MQGVKDNRLLLHATDIARLPSISTDNKPSMQRERDPVQKLETKATGLCHPIFSWNIKEWNNMDLQEMLPKYFLTLHTTKH